MSGRAGIVIAAAILAAAGSAGCQHGDTDPATHVEYINPTLKPRNEKESKLQAEMEASGNHAKEQMAAAAAAMKAARAKSGAP